jgi:hypothetical protein
VRQIDIYIRKYVNNNILAEGNAQYWFAEQTVIGIEVYKTGNFIYVGEPHLNKPLWSPSMKPLVVVPPPPSPLLQFCFGASNNGNSLTKQRCGDRRNTDMTEHTNGNTDRQ